MFGHLFKSRKSETPSQTTPPPQEELRLAIAALLVEAARADEAYEENEKSLIDRALSATFKLDTGAAASLRAKGEAAQATALDIHRFTKLAKQLSEAEKIELAEHLWTIILSDNVRDPHEDTLMRRICGLIYLADRESGAARARIAAKLEKG